MIPPDLNCLSHWFPPIRDAGLPVPKTLIVTISDEELADCYNVFDGKELTAVVGPFFKRIQAAAELIGYPCFLRTGQTSGKHSWSRTCFLTEGSKIVGHVLNLIEFSEMGYLVGLDCRIWAVREFLPTMPLGTCPGYQYMPICREFRVFVTDGDVTCCHPYWPLDALVQGGLERDVATRLYRELIRLDVAEQDKILDLARRAGAALGGAWSIDLLETGRGWYLTDMAVADQSYHWPGCEHAKPPARPGP